MKKGKKKNLLYFLLFTSLILDTFIGCDNNSTVYYIIDSNDSKIKSSSTDNWINSTEFIPISQSNYLEPGIIKKDNIEGAMIGGEFLTSDGISNDSSLSVGYSGKFIGSYLHGLIVYIKSGSLYYKSINLTSPYNNMSSETYIGAYGSGLTVDCEYFNSTERFVISWFHRPGTYGYLYFKSFIWNETTNSLTEEYSSSTQMWVYSGYTFGKAALSNGSCYRYFYDKIGTLTNPRTYVINWTANLQLTQFIYSGFDYNIDVGDLWSTPNGTHWFKNIDNNIQYDTSPVVNIVPPVLTDMVVVGVDNFYVYARNISDSNTIVYKRLIYPWNGSQTWELIYTCYDNFVGFDVSENGEKIVIAYTKGSDPNLKYYYTFPKNIPRPPSNFIADPYPGEIFLHWNPPKSNGGSPITNYKIYKGNTSDDLQYYTTIGNTSSYTDPISLEQEYYYQISAINENGEGTKTEIQKVNAILVNTGITLNQLPNQKVHYGTDQSLNWTAIDETTLYPSYSIFRDDIEVQNGKWKSGNEVLVSLNTLEVGNYVFYVNFSDGYGENAIDIVLVEIFNAPFQIIQQPDDEIIEIGSTNNYLDWNLTDLSTQNPLYNLTMNGTNIMGGVWNSSNNLDLHINIDGFSNGQYDFCLNATDGLEDFWIDYVTIQVEPNYDPILSDFENLSYYFGEQNQKLNWTIIDRIYSDTVYYLYRNQELVQTNAWVSDQLIEYIIPYDLPVGEYTFNLTVLDGRKGTAERTTQLSILNPIPLINPPDDITIEYLAKGVAITWIIMDNWIKNSSYQIYQNGELVKTGSWISGESISQSLDNLDLGVYNFTIIVNDGAGETISDQVIVNVEFLSVSSIIALTIRPIIGAVVSFIAGIAIKKIYENKKKRKLEIKKEKIQQKDVDLDGDDF